MSKRLSFSIAVNLLTENFKKGTSTVKNSLRSLQMQVLTFAAALGAGGLGISGLITRFKDVARETSRVLTALKNVSDGSKGFADNLRFVNDLAKKYGLEINALTGNFAKFTASATQANMPMEQQKKVFESVSRAITAFGLSASESDGVMLALSQMMGKGKISSEELRKQMGEKLPVAMQAMAKALGVSMAELEKLLKQGKVMSADVLPKFADALNEIIPNVDTDSLEGSLSRLSNMFGSIVDSSGFTNKYKALIDGLTSLLESVSKNIQNIIVGIVAAIGFVVTRGLTKIHQGHVNTGNMIVANAQSVRNKMIASAQSRIIAENKLEDLKLQHAQATGAKQVQLANQIEKQKQLVSAKTLATNKLHEEAKALNAQVSATKANTAWGKAYLGMHVSAIKLMASIKSMWNSFAPAIIISAIIAVIGYFKNLYDETKRVKNIFSDYKKEAENAGNNNQEIKNLQTQLSIMNDKKKGVEDIKSAQDALNKLLGVEGKNQEELNKLVAKRVELLIAAAKADYYTRKSLEAEDEREKVYAKYGGKEGLDKALEKREQNLSNMNPIDRAVSNFGKSKGLHNSFLSPQITKDVIAIEQYNKVIQDADEAIKEYTNEANKLTPFTPTGGNPDNKAQKNAKKIADELLSLQKQNAQSAIDLMDDTRKKRIAQIELDYNQEIAVIKEKEKEWSDAQKGKLTTDQIAALTYSYELAEQKKNKAIERNDKEALANILKSKVEYLKQYGSFQQKKLAIAEEYAKKIQQAEKDGNSFEIALLKKQQQSDISAVEFAAIKAEIDWQSVLGDFGMMLEEQIKPTLERLKEYTKSNEFDTAGIEDKRIIYDAINRMEKQISGGLNTKMFSDLASDIQRYQDSLRSLISAKAKEEEAAKDLAKANKKLKESQLGNTPATIESAKKNADNAQAIFDQASESVLNLTAENNKYAENLKSSSANTIGALQNMEEGLSQLSSGSLKTALQGVGKISESVGGKVGSAISKAFAGKGIIGEIIAAVIGILDILKDGIGTLVSGLIDSVLNAVDGILSNILSGKFFEQIGVSLFKGVRNILDTVSFGAFSSNGNAKEVNELVNKLTNSNKYLITAIEKLTNEMSKSGGLKSTIYYESAVNKQLQKNENDRQMLEARMGYNAAHHSNNYYIEKAFNAEDWKKASDYVGKKLSKVGDLWKLSPEDLAKLQELPDIWAKINSGKYDQSEWLDEYVSDANTLIELTEQWQDAITDTSFDNIRSEMKSLLVDFKTTSEDIIDSVNEFMKNAILHSITSGTYSDMIKEWQAEFAKAMADGILSEKEADYLRKKYQDIYNQAIVDRDTAYQAAGIEDIEDDNGTSQSASKGYSVSMDQDTGDKMVGILTSMQMSGLKMEGLLSAISLDTANIFKHTANMNSEMAKQTNILNNIYQVQRNSFFEVEGTGKYLKDMNGKLANIETYTKALE